MWYRITLRLSDNKILSGIRQIDDENLYKIELMTFEAAKKTIGLHRVKALDLTPLSEDHPEVKALVSSGKEIRQLK
ncbi:MAG TPA: hypothetical protein VMT76_07075 [Puia sp.]|nr:hypothetical protein [Puia sp.]